MSRIDPPPKVLLDTCVLFPNITREILFGAARLSLFEPLFSKSILDEWQHVATRKNVGAEARITIALLRREWPKSLVDEDKDLEQSLSLPDPSDCHVLAAAITGKSDELLTRNLKDFPTRTLAKYGILRRDPDGFLHEFGAALEPVIDAVHQQAVSTADAPITRRRLLKKAGLPRLGKYFM